MCNLIVGNVFTPKEAKYVSILNRIVSYFLKTFSEFSSFARICPSEKKACKLSTMLLTLGHMPKNPNAQTSSIIPRQLYKIDPFILKFFSASISFRCLFNFMVASSCPCFNSSVHTCFASSLKSPVFF